MLWKNMQTKTALFNDWHVQNGKGYEVEIDPELWKKGPEILACDPGVIKIHIRIMQMENQLWIRACLKIH